MTNYLIDEKGYGKSRLASVEGVYGFKLPQCYTSVIFETEPYIKYIYLDHDEVLKFDYEIVDIEHKDKKGKSF